MVEIEQIEEESQVPTIITEANDLIFVVTARLDETKNIRENMEIRLGYVTNRLQNSDNSNEDDVDTQNLQDENGGQNIAQGGATSTISQNSSAGSRPNVYDDATIPAHRSIKPPQATSPKFYGNAEDF
ncbi:hypothetical protein Y032_0071g577 [Ancylostoma ceylanicum]|uniref:Uncharacterized protein n=1 Tax=Ancylostoma ceylanicum TaxID=53326 RepID=A0A016TWV2_9BILA|nr:hypothetical protein Y032_0071g577 [Ancylostoma ceylanicum]